jgi:hypothetical protein
MHIKDSADCCNLAKSYTDMSQQLCEAMQAHGIPARMTRVIADELMIEHVADLASLSMLDLLFADVQFRGRLIALRNAHKRDGDQAWPVPPDAAWPALGQALCGV